MSFRIYRLALLAAVFVLPTLPALAITGDDINQATFAPATKADSKTETKSETKPKSKSETKAAKKQPDPRVVKAQVLLDRRRISPGVIDGFDGENFHKAMAELRRRDKLPDGKTLDAHVWRALDGDAASDIVMDYTVTEQDAAYKFAPTPKDYAELATLKAIGYRTAAEMIGERFHMDEDLVRDLNPTIENWHAGDRLVVTRVRGDSAPATTDGQSAPTEKKSAPIESKSASPMPKSELRVAHIVISRGRGMVTAFDAKDEVLGIYPATVGSAATPTPSGHYTVKGVAKNPTYTYRPDVNFKQGDNDKPLVLPPGPNGPVGSVWIDLSKPTFGIHGTPEPSTVSKTASHGCVRLTNWDAEELASMTKPGVKVDFVD